MKQTSLWVGGCGRGDVVLNYKRLSKVKSELANFKSLDEESAI